MSHPLDGARLKVVRAQEHLDSLKAEVGMYMNAKPYRFPAKQKGIEWTVQSEVAEPPIRFSTLVGDCVVNARAALDYIVWQLAQRYFVPPVDLTNRNDRQITASPLFLKKGEPGLQNRLNCLAMRQMPALAVAEIEKTQPYYAGNESLWWLHELVNNDKHRLPLLTFGHIDAAVIEVVKRVAGIGTSIARRGGYGAIGLTFTDATFGAEGPSREGDGMEVYDETSFFVALQDAAVPRMPVEVALEQIVKTTANVIPRFEAFF